MSISIAPTYTQRNYSWTSWKSVYATKGSPLQYDDDGIMYTIWTYDGPEVHICQIRKGIVPDGAAATYSQAQNDADKTDFETNYRSLGNLPLSQLDSDGAQIIRNKASKKGWTYTATAFEFTTSALNSLIALNLDGTAKTYIIVSYFDINGSLITNPSSINTAVRTQVDFEPPYDYEVIGGEMRLQSQLITDMRLFIIAVPDIPVQYGGSKVMAEGLNLRYLYPGNLFQVDGRVSKFLQYSATNHTNKLRFVLWHAAGVQDSLMITVELYRQ